jgi:transcriptional regulator with XRE-family HTH domain
MLTPAQLRAARGLLGWTLVDLAKASGIHRNSINSFEIEASDPKRSTLLALERALGKAGVVFIDADKEGGPGVRLRS